MLRANLFLVKILLLLLFKSQEKFKQLADELSQHKLRHPGKSSLMIKFIMNRAFRNIVYKPSLGLYPVPYKLELYKNV